MAEQGISAVFETGAQKQGKEGRPGEHSLGSTGGMDRGGGRLQLELCDCVSDDHEYWVWQNSKSVDWFYISHYHYEYNNSLSVCKMADIKL